MSVARRSLLLFFIRTFFLITLAGGALLIPGMLTSLSTFKDVQPGVDVMDQDWDWESFSVVFVFLLEILSTRNKW